MMHNFEMGYGMGSSPVWTTITIVILVGLAIAVFLKSRRKK